MTFEEWMDSTPTGMETLRGGQLWNLQRDAWNASHEQYNSLAAENRGMRDLLEQVIGDLVRPEQGILSPWKHSLLLRARSALDAPLTAREVERVKDLESLAEIVGESAPLLWAVKGMEAEANEWEKKAKAALDRLRR